MSGCFPFAYKIGVPCATLAYHPYHVSLTPELTVTILLYANAKTDELFYDLLLSKRIKLVSIFSVY